MTPEQPANPFQSKINNEISDLVLIFSGDPLSNESIADRAHLSDERRTKEVIDLVQSNVMRDYLVSLRDMYECLSHDIVLDEQQKKDLALILNGMEEKVIQWMKVNKANSAQEGWIKLSEETYIPKLKQLTELN